MAQIDDASRRDASHADASRADTSRRLDSGLAAQRQTAVVDEGSLRIAFWFGFPMVLGLFSGTNQIGMLAPKLSLAWSLIYWLLLAAIMWAGLGLGSWIVRRQVPRLGLFAMLTLGAVLGVALTRPLHALYQGLFQPLTEQPELVTILPLIPTTLAAVLQLYTGNALLIFFWVGGGLFFARFLRFAPLIGLIGEQAAPPPAPACHFARRLLRIDFAALDAIQAEDHYTRAFSAQDQELVLYRFSDAASELQARGWVRVHRSHCVRRDRVAGVSQRGRTLILQMAGGREVPVSERFHAVAMTLAQRG
jgi:hypothetical protein